MPSTAAYQRKTRAAQAQPVHAKSASPVKITQFAVSPMPLVQAKLRVGPGSDDLRMRAPAVAPSAAAPDAVQRKCSACVAGSRSCPECAEEELGQRKANDPVRPTAAPTLTSQVELIRSGGRPLSRDERRFFEPRFGYNFENARLHTGPDAQEAAQSINARAFTVGEHIAFAKSQFKPGSTDSAWLLAHELAHVVQQGGAPNLSPLIQRATPQAENPGCQDSIAPRKLSDVFKVYTIMTAKPEDFSVTMIGFRAEHVLKAKLYFVGDTLYEGWKIKEIRNEGVEVENASCRKTDFLSFDGSELSPETDEPTETFNFVSDSKFGPGYVATFDNCKEVMFAPKDAPDSDKYYEYGELTKSGMDPLPVYFLEGNRSSPISPSELEDTLHIHLIGDKCGTPKTVESRKLAPEDFNPPI